MKKFFQAAILPPEVSEFERNYLARLNRITNWFFVLHVPVFVLVAFLNDTGPLTAAWLTLLTLSVPFLASRVFDSPRHVSLTHGFTSMILGGLLVHFGQGPVQIEMHFYFFASLAMLAVYGNPLVIVVAAVTVAAHHGLIWWYLPASVFNYDAPFWVVAIHAGFVVLESVATCFIARSFFDNVIGLEKIVQARTVALNARNQQMRLVMDHVDQGFITVTPDGTMAEERSKIVAEFLGQSEAGESFASYLKRSSPRVADAFELSWDQITEGFLPLDVCLGQLPTRLEIGNRYFSIGYTPILESGELERVLVVLSDRTNEVERERFEAESREVLGIFERVMKDKVGFLEFFEEASEQVANITSDLLKDSGLLKRVLHTLKGNSLMFGIGTVAEICHSMEEEFESEGERPSESSRKELAVRWDHLRKNLESMLGERADKTIEVPDAEYEATLKQILSDGVSRLEIARRVANWKLEHTSTRLNRVAEQARSIAKRLNKSEVEIQVEGSDLLLDPDHWSSFWASFVHVIRNALDHGIETNEERTEAGKDSLPLLQLTTKTEGNEFIIALNDNGRGVDWERVANKAQSLGLPVLTQNDLVEALFAEGMSTKQEVTEYSGRGVGMGAVRYECESRQGRIDVRSEVGAGTTVEFRFPCSEMASDPMEPSGLMEKEQVA